MLQGIPAPPAPPPMPDLPTQVIVNGPPTPWDLPPPAVAMIVIAGLIVAGIVLWPLMRAIGRRIERGAATVDPAEVEELRQRVHELEERQARMFELEERLDFAERLLAERSREEARLEGGESRT